jgi:NitT/TauT family transport system permease protein
MPVLARILSGRWNPSRDTLRRGLQIATVGVGLSIWEALARSPVLDAGVLPPFSAVVGTLAALLANGVLVTPAVTTLSTAFLAFVIAAPLAVLTGYLLGIRTAIGAVLDPAFNLAIAIPQSIFLPVFLFVFGTGTLMKVVFGITHAFVIVVASTASAADTLDEDLLLTVRSWGATDWQLFRHVYVYAVLPTILTGLRLGMILAMTGVLIAEMYVSQSGIGRVLITWGRGFAFEKFFAALLLVAVLTVAVNESLRLIERRVEGWRP